MNRNIPIDLYWFSGTAHSLVLAQTAQERLHDLRFQTRMIPLEKSTPASFIPGRTTGIIVPVAGQGTYPLVWDFLNNMPKGKGEEVFLIDTMALLIAV